MSSDDHIPLPKMYFKQWFKRFIAHLNREPQNTKELIAILRDMEAEHFLKRDIMTMMERIATLEEMTVEEVMVPRAEMVTINEDSTFDAVLAIVIESGHSRFPVVSRAKEEVRGILLAKDLLQYVSHEKRPSFVLSKNLRPPAFIGENKALDILLRDFRYTRNHLAIVVDQYGDISGLVSLEDVLEQIVGEIDDEYDRSK